MQRQMWIFLAPEDEAGFIERLTGPDALVRLEGRFFRSSGKELLAGRDPDGAQLSAAGERWIHFVNPAITSDLVMHPVEEGPFAGRLRLDEVRSDVLTLVRPADEGKRLGPSRLFGASHEWFGGEKLRKSADFTLWMSRAMGRVEEAFPATEHDWLRVAPGAVTYAREGGQLHYLYREIRLVGSDMTPHTPHKRL